MPFFSVIIVSWNALDHLKNFLPSVVSTDYPDFEIILADNASTDGSADWVRANFPDVKISTFNKNHGYCGGNNRAVPYAKGDILVFLNNDVQVAPDWLTHLSKCFDRDEAVAAVQPKMRSYEEPDYFEYAGAAGGFIDKYGFPFCRGRLFDTLEKDKGQYDDPSDIFWASGAALAIRKEVFREMEGFDEDFEFHMEEVDLCWRLWNAGYKIRFCPESVVYHLGGGSLPMGSPRKVYYNYRNSLIMLWKNYSSFSLFFHFPVRLALDLTAALRELLTGHFDEFKAILKGHLHFYMSLTRTQTKRKKVQKSRKTSGEPHIMLNKSVVIEYFLRNRRQYDRL